VYLCVNYRSPPPLRYYSYERLRLLEKTFHDKEEKILALPALSPESVTKHIAGTLNGGVCLSLYCGGNLDSDDALRIYSRVREALGTSIHV